MCFSTPQDKVRIACGALGSSASMWQYQCRDDPSIVIFCNALTKRRKIEPPSETSRACPTAASRSPSAIEHQRTLGGFAQLIGPRTRIKSSVLRLHRWTHQRDSPESKEPSTSFPDHGHRRYDKYHIRVHRFEQKSSGEDSEEPHAPRQPIGRPHL